MGSLFKKDDRELIIMSREGNDQAFQTLISKYNALVFKVSYDFVKEYYTAQDISQEVFIKLYDNKGKYKKAFMVPDNAIAVEELEIDMSNFKEGESCTPGSFEEGIYWSVKNYDKNTITLNGCGGADYEWRRENNSQIEYFK